MPVSPRHSEDSIFNDQIMNVNGTMKIRFTKEGSLIPRSVVGPSDIYEAMRQMKEAMLGRTSQMKTPKIDLTNKTSPKNYEMTQSPINLSRFMKSRDSSH